MMMTGIPNLTEIFERHPGTAAASSFLLPKAPPCWELSESPCLAKEVREWNSGNLILWSKLFCKIQFLTKVPVPPLDLLPRVRVALTESVGKDVRIKVWICFCLHPRCSCHCSQSYCCGFCCFCYIFHRCPSRKMLVADVPPPEGSNIRFRWVEIMDSSWLSSTLIIMDSKRTKRLWLSFTVVMPQGGGARHGGRQQDAVPREKVAIVTILVAAQHDHLHHQLQWSPSYQLLVTISMASKIPWRWKKSKRLGKKFEGRAASLEVMIAV